MQYSTIHGFGIYPIFKPKGPSSHAIVNQVRRLTGIKRVGHGGTLDPLASGVLVIAVGREYTKQLVTYVKQEKEYVTTFKLGETSTTDDEEGEKRVVSDQLSVISENEIKNILPKFTGLIDQIPPAYSAVKIKGTPAYKLARKIEKKRHSELISESGTDTKHQIVNQVQDDNKEKLLQLQPRQREVKSIELLSYSWPFLQLRIVTGKGVYIRALARDIGQALGTGAYMAALERTRVGQYKVEDSIHLSLPERQK